MVQSGLIIFPDKGITELITIWKPAFGEELTFDEAHAQAMRRQHFYRVVYDAAARLGIDPRREAPALGADTDTVAHTAIYAAS